MPRYPEIKKPSRTRKYVIVFYGPSSNFKPRSIGRTEPFVATKYQANLFLMEALDKAFHGSDKDIVGGAVLELQRE